MRYEDFLKKITAMVQERLGDQVRVCLHTIYKNNDLKKEAMCILEEGSNVSPTIYLEPYYRKLEMGVSWNGAISELLDEYRTNRCGLYLDVEEFQVFERVSSRIVYKLLNYEKNRALLENVPHRRYLDLAVVYYFLIENHFIGSGTAMIHNQQMKVWGVSEEILYQAARENTDRLLGNEITAMDQVIRELLKKDLMYQMNRQICCDGDGEDQAEFLTDQILTSLLPEQKYVMYVMSNSNKYLGASAVLNHSRLSDFAKKHNCGFYVVPSSIHEVILMPETEPLDKTDLKQLLSDINMAGEDSQEFLSDQVYYFDREGGGLRL